MTQRIFFGDITFHNSLQICASKYTQKCFCYLIKRPKKIPPPSFCLTAFTLFFSFLSAHYSSLHSFILLASPDSFLF
ncbi:unnamed protein product [Meloidogyne enterolobii]|uniref:Uncharacterized protein n=1 Tax=Meloidogyne enterolobii TaxID=390850 RepID=A0ACB0YUN8_MELEN